MKQHNPAHFCDMWCHLWKLVQPLKSKIRLPPAPAGASKNEESQDPQPAFTHEYSSSNCDYQKQAIKGQTEHCEC